MEKAGIIYTNLTTLQLEQGGERIVWTDDAPEELRKEWSDFTGKHSGYNFNELEEYYTVLQMLTSYMNGYEDFTIDELYQCDWRDIYNSDRLDWVKANLERAELFDDVKDNGADGLFALIGDMQDIHRHDIAHAILTEFLGIVEEE